MLSRHKNVTHKHVKSTSLLVSSLVVVPFALIMLLLQLLLLVIPNGVEYFQSRVGGAGAVHGVGTNVIKTMNIPKPSQFNSRGQRVLARSELKQGMKKKNGESLQFFQGMPKRNLAYLPGSKPFAGRIS
jgi:hypothetical protein